MSTRSTVTSVLGRVLTTCAVAAALAVVPAADAAVFKVTTTDDGYDLSPGDGSCDAGHGVCTLRAAIEEANANSDSDEIYLMVHFREYELTLGTLEVTSRIYLEGQFDVITCGFGSGAAIEVGTAPRGRLRAQWITITGCRSAIVNHGSLTLWATHVSGAESGAIHNDGHLLLYDTTVSGNQTSGDGGGLRNFDQGTARVLSSRFVDNSAAGQGGAIYNDRESWLEGSVVEFNLNSAGEYGGGVRNEGSMVMEHARFFGNSARSGGGLSNLGRVKNSLTMSSFFMNRSNGWTSQDCGGGIHQDTGRLVIVNSTIADNLADGDGGGLCVVRGIAELSNVTVAYNRANADGNDLGTGSGLYSRDPGIVLTRNSILAANAVPVGGGAPDCVGLFDSDGYNLFGIADERCAVRFGGVDDWFGSFDEPIDPGLGDALFIDGDRGTGLFTDYRPLEPTSVALDNGDPSGCLDPLTGQKLYSDQIEFDRHSGGRCDRGAIELQR